MLQKALDTLHRRDGGRLLASLLRQLGSLDLAEEALQDAYAKALERWPRDGVPANPPAWIATVARRRGIDRLRHDRRNQSGSDALLAELPEPGDGPGSSEAETAVDERLSLIFTCCHPALARPAQVALALRTLCGLSTAEIARAFVEPEPTTAQRLVRAKRKIAAAGVPFAIPPWDRLPERLTAVLAVIYFMFNEGYAAQSGGALLRPDLCVEGVRLGRLLLELMQDDPEVHGLLALMLFHESRRGARIDEAHRLVTLEAQDRTRWNAAMRIEANSLLDHALGLRTAGPYQIQAAIAALHSNATTAADTDWLQISALYAALLRHLPTPVVELNAAVALAMSSTPEAGLAWIERIEAGGSLEHYHLLYAARADLEQRLGRLTDARASYAKAIVCATNRAEQRHLQSRLQEIHTEQ